MIFPFLVISYSIGLMWNVHLLPEKIIFEFETHHINISFYVNGKNTIFKTKNLKEKQGKSHSINFGFEMTPFFDSKNRGFFLDFENDFGFNYSFFDDYYEKSYSYTFSFGLLYNIPFCFKDRDFNFRIKFYPLLQFSRNKRTFKYKKTYEETITKNWYLNLGRSNVYFLLFLLI